MRCYSMAFRSTSHNDHSGPHPLNCFFFFLLFVRQMVEAEQLPDINIESCDCLGECGYGPNILVNNIKLINNVRGEEAIRQVLGLSSRGGGQPQQPKEESLVAMSDRVEETSSA
jgi:hypothetical protein